MSANVAEITEVQSVNASSHVGTTATTVPAAEKNKLLVKHRNLIKIIVAKMRANLPAHADFEELESAGLMGLISATDRFDPSRGYTFETYASTRIRGAILDELRKLDMMPRSARNKQRKLNEAVKVLEQRLGRAPTDVELRDELGLKEKKFRKMRAYAEPVTIVCLDQNNQEDGCNLHEVIPDEREMAFTEQFERKELAALIADKTGELPEQQRKVLALNFHEGLRLSEIGQIMGVSEARVSQIRSQAIATLRRYVNRMSH